MDGNNGRRQVAEAGSSAASRYSGFGRKNFSAGSQNADGSGDMRIG
jgi:hypothetical protein